jgi:2-desacetyl-2-hydroxyethyl bacteriochlorophyllide A dehydrogenase
MRAALLAAPGKVEVREIQRPLAARGEVLVDVHACGICGSDLHAYAGEAPLPRVCPGHEICGRVAVDSPTGQPGTPVVVEPIFACGRCASCVRGEPNLCPALELIGGRRHGGFADVVVAPATSVHFLPPALDLDTAVLAEPLAVAVHGVGRIAPPVGSAVLVVGGGTIGLLTVFVLARSGCEVTLAVRYPHQANLGLGLGAARVVGAERETVLEAVRGRAPDVVFETVGGHAEPLDLALAAVRAGGSIVTLGVFSRPLSLHPLRFLAKEATLTAAMMYSRKGGRSDFATALSLLCDHREQLASVITHRVPLERIDEAFRIAGDKRSGAVKVSVDVAREQ